MNDLLKGEQPKTIELADGKEYKLGPINLNVLANMEEEFGCSLDGLSKKFDKQQASSLRSLVYLLLKENHPDMTKEQAGKLISLSAVPEVSTIISEIIKAVKTI